LYYLENSGLKKVDFKKYNLEFHIVFAEKFILSVSMGKLKTGCVWKALGQCASQAKCI